MARPRFTLRSAFLTVTVFAFVLSVWTSARQFRENQRLRAENTFLRNEVGKLTIDPGQEHELHAIAIPSFEKYTWRWRIKVPNGKSVRVRTKVGEIPAEGFPKGEKGPELVDESVLTIAIHRTTDKSWELYWQVAKELGGGVSTSAPGARKLSPENLKWIEESAGSTQIHRVTNRTFAVAVDEPLPLLRLRFTPDGTQPKHTDLLDGIIVWLSNDNTATP